MSNLQGYQFAALPQRKPEDPIARRREKLLRGFEKQAALLKNPNFRSKEQRAVVNAEGIKEAVERTRAVRPWWFKDEAAKP